MQFLGNRSTSNYNSLQVTLTKRYSHGLYLLAGYTYGHAIDTATSNLAGVPPDSNNYNAERGNGDYDLRHRFTLSMTYDLPSIKTKGQLLEGWQATSIVNVQSGEPYTLGDFSNDISFTGEFNDRWNFTGNPGDIHCPRRHRYPSSISRTMLTAILRVSRRQRQMERSTTCCSTVATSKAAP